MSEIILKTDADIEKLMKHCISQEFEAFAKKYFPEDSKVKTDPEENFTIKQLADYWQVHPQTIMKQKRAGLLPFYQNRRTVMFKKSEIDAISAVPTSRRRK